MKRIVESIIKKIIIDDSLKTSNPVTIGIENAIGDDVAKVRTNNSNEIFVGSNDSKNENTEKDMIFKENICVESNDQLQNNLSSSMTHSLVTSRNKQKNDGNDLERTILKSTLVALGVNNDESEDEKVEKKVNELHHSRRCDTPINDFLNNDFILCAGFPHVFMTGQLYDTKQGSFTDKQRKHLLNQYNNIPAQCIELLFFLFNQGLRHEHARNVCAAVRTHSTAFKEFSKLTNSDAFQDKLKNAVKDPKSDDAKYVLNKVTPVLRFSGKHNTYSPILMNRLRTIVYAMTQRYGPASWFLTVAPHDINNLTVWRLSFIVSSNKKFPSVVDDSFFSDASINNDDYDDNIEFELKPSYFNRLKVVSENPVASTIEFMRVMKNILESLIKTKIESGFGEWKLVRKSVPYTKNKKGCFGYTMGFAMKPEVNGKKTYHAHLIGFGSLPPYLLQMSAISDVLQKAIEKALDVMYTSSLPREWHIADIIDKERKKRKLKKDVLSMGPPTSLIAPERMKLNNEFSIRTCCFCGVHSHSFTCFKNKHGLKGCRMNYPQGLIEKSKPVGLMIIENEKEKTIQAVDLPHDDFKLEILNRDLNKELIPLYDEKPIVWETKRPVLESIPEFDMDVKNFEKKSKIIDYLIKNIPKSVNCKETKNWLIDMSD